MSILHLSRPIGTCSSPSNKTKELAAKNNKKEKEYEVSHFKVMMVIRRIFEDRVGRDEGNIVDNNSNCTRPGLLDLFDISTY